MKKLFGAIGIAVLLMVLMPQRAVFASDGRQIAKGVLIGPVDVSGMSVNEAESAVTSYVDSVSTEPITLYVGEGKERQVTGQDIGLYWSNTSVVEDAYSLGHHGNIIQRYKALKDLQHQNHIFDIEYGYEKELLEGIVANCANEYDQETINYTLTKTADGFVVSDGQTGYLVDQPGSVSAIESFIQDSLGKGQAKVDLIVKADEPKGSAEELSKVRDVLGTYTTSYKSSGAARSANVANGCSLINGATIYPGEEFSVLDTITPFTEANGYFPAGS